MTAKLFFQAMGRFFLGAVLAGLLIFLPAGSIRFPNGWLLMGILFVPMFFAGVWMMIRDPQLLRRRLQAKEGQKAQGRIVKLSALMFAAGFIAAGLGYRLGWYMLPGWAVRIAAGAFLAAYILYGEVLRENSYLSRTIRVEEGQKVIDKGLYAVVRHPMYSATLLLFLSMPLVLGSVYGFLIFLAYPFLIVRRIFHEEALLEKELDGYREYKQRVKYRLIPFVW